jgi:hypothetical protein
MDCSFKKTTGGFLLAFFLQLNRKEKDRLLLSPPGPERRRQAALFYNITGRRRQAAFFSDRTGRRRQAAFFSNRTGYVASGLALERLEGLHQEVFQVLKIIKL